MKDFYFEGYTFDNLNKKQFKRPLYFKILWAFVVVFMILSICYSTFNIVFIKAQVVGISMIPTYNKNLDATTVYDTEYYENSPYKDYVFANRYDKGSNNDIILLKLNNELVIKRIIATSGQTVTLKKGNGETDLTNYYYYVDDVLLDESYIYNRDDMNLNYFNRFCFGDGIGYNRNIDVEVVIPTIEANFVVPENTFFILGDNRLVSGDSVRFGTVGVNDVFGKVVISYEYNQTFIGYIWQKICSIF